MPLGGALAAADPSGTTNDCMGAPFDPVQEHEQATAEYALALNECLPTMTAQDQAAI